MSPAATRDGEPTKAPAVMNIADPVTATWPGISTGGGTTLILGACLAMAERQFSARSGSLSFKAGGAVAPAAGEGSIATKNAASTERDRRCDRP